MVVASTSPEGERNRCPGRQFTGKATRLQTLLGGFSLSGGLGSLFIAYGNAPAWSSAHTRQCNDGANSLAWSARPEVAALGGLRRLRPGVPLDPTKYHNQFGNLLLWVEAVMFGLPVAAVFVGFIEMMMRERAGIIRAQRLTER